MKPRARPQPRQSETDRIAGRAGVDRYRAQHLDLAERAVDTPGGVVHATMDDGESPLAWLARRKGRDGRALIDPAQLQAGDRLRAEFTRAQMMPRITSSWGGVSGGARGAGPVTFTETVIAARQRVRQALDAAGPEFSGLLLDVCCFLKGLSDAERERGWPARSGKVVLQLGLDRLARHYGFNAVARGRSRVETRTWVAPE